MKWWTPSEAQSVSKGSKKSSELLQIMILALFMTGGFFALASGVLVLLIPGRVDATRSQANDLQELQKLLAANSDLRKTRDQVNEFKKAGADVDLREIIDKNMDDLVFSQKPEVLKKKLGKGKTWEYTQPLKLQATGLQSLFNLIGRVKQTQSSIRVGSFNLSRERRANAKDSWNSSFTFYHYRNEEVLRKPGGPAAAAQPAESETKAAAAPADGDAEASPAEDVREGE